MTGRTRVVVFGLRGLDHVEGGVETHARELYPRLAALGLDVRVLVRRGYPASPATWAARGVRLTPLWAPRGAGLEAFGHALVCTLHCLLTRPDVVHVHGIGPGAFARVLRLAGLRVVVTVHGHDYDAAKWGPVARALLRAGERRSVRDASAVVAVSHGLAGDLLADHGARAVVVGNGLPSWGEEPPADPALDALLVAPYVVVVGRLTAHKRVLDVVDALAPGSPAPAGLRLLVCGDRDTDDPYAAAVEDAARRHPHVLLAGHVEPEQLPRVYRRAACLVMASSYEGLPLAVLEAVAAGCPVLLSDIPAHVELGLAPFQYYPVGDAARLAAGLAHLLSLPRAEAVAAQARCLDDPRLDWDHIARETAAVLTGTGGDQHHRPGVPVPCTQEGKP